MCVAGCVAGYVMGCKECGVAARRGDLLDVDLRREQLQARGGEEPGVAQCRGAVLGQVLLPQVAGQADDPGVLALRHVCKHPDVRGADHVELVADGRRTPLGQRLQVDAAGTVQQVGLGVRGAGQRAKVSGAMRS